MQVKRSDSRLQNLMSKSRMLPQQWDGCAADGIGGLIDLAEAMFPSNATLVEVGSFRGVSTACWCALCASVISVDPFDTIPCFGQETEDRIAAAKKEFFSQIDILPNLQHIMAPSAIARQEVADESVDVVYIDGDHRYYSVIDDIVGWSRKVRSGGVVCGHDYYGEIKRAVDDAAALLEISALSIRVFSDSSWAWVKP